LPFKGKDYLCTLKQLMINIVSWDAISPVDGRYRKTCEPLAVYFSESALMRYRVRVEAAYLAALCKLDLDILRPIKPEVVAQLEELASGKLPVDVAAIKKFESVTNHDVKAVEYYIRDVFGTELGNGDGMIHFGLTSQDINNTAVPMLLKDAQAHVLMPALEKVIDKLSEYSKLWAEIPMLARTHGQPASPTTLGKEIAVFTGRLRGQTELLKTIPWSAKFGGATGNFNAHYAAFPKVDWVKFGNTFVASLGLERTQVTTQIEPYDHLAALFDNWKRINNILMDLCRDMWTYISMNYFSQEVKKGEVGSSAMPHKVNPIDFENAEGNIGMANAVFEHLSSKLPVSRLQRDLTDSTALRNCGVPFAHTFIAITALLRGMNKIQVNQSVLHADLEDNWAVVAEAIQTVLRREGYPNPYEALKDLTRTGAKITRETLHEFIGKLDVNDRVREELLKFSPHSYTGVASKLAKG
jgi:adenylosuccinate lyase